MADIFRQRLLPGEQTAQPVLAPLNPDAEEFKRLFDNTVADSVALPPVSAGGIQERVRNLAAQDVRAYVGGNQIDVIPPLRPSAQGVILTRPTTPWLLGFAAKQQAFPEGRRVVISEKGNLFFAKSNAGRWVMTPFELDAVDATEMTSLARSVADKVIVERGVASADAF